VGTVIANPHTARIRHLVVEFGPDRLSQWVDVERAVPADHRQVFGEACGPQLSDGTMTERNNICTAAQAWLGRIELPVNAGSPPARHGAP